MQLGNDTKTSADELDRRLHRLREAARTAGVKLTHQRVEIFRVVASSIEHPSAEQVFQTARASIPTVSLDTVYRTLRLLTELGLLTEIALPRQGLRFDANTRDHHHFVCLRCGLVRDFESAELDALRIPSSVERFGRTVSTNVEVRGICQRCADDPTEPGPPAATGGQHADQHRNRTS